MCNAIVTLNQKIMRKFLYFIATIFLPALLSSCSNAQHTSNNIYSKNREWTFNAKFIDNEGATTDSCLIKMKVSKPHFISFIANQTPIIYTYEINSKKYEEKTGVEEDESGVFIHPPRLGDFSFLQVPPMPGISYPLNSIREKEIELNTLKSEFKPASGKKIKQQLKQNNEKDTLVFKDQDIECVKLTGQNINYTEEIGTYKAEYWFSEVYGFMKMRYLKPDNSVLEIVLIETNF